MLKGARAWGTGGAIFLALSFSPGCGDDAPPPRLSALEAEVFAVSCAFSSCHGGAAPEQALNLSGKTFEQLVGRASQQLSSRTLVIPGDPDRSFLLEKLEKEQPEIGSRMPPDSAGGALEPSVVDAVREWIRRGAQND